MKKYLISLFIGLLFISINVFAAASLGDVANNLLVPAQGLGKMLNAMCFIAGIGFLLGGLLQYKYHRENPQQVKISTPLFLVALGLALVAVPFIAMLSESGKFLN